MLSADKTEVRQVEKFKSDTEVKFVAHKWKIDGDFASGDPTFALVFFKFFCGVVFCYYGWALSPPGGCGERGVLVMSGVSCFVVSCTRACALTHTHTTPGLQLGNWLR